MNPINKISLSRLAITGAVSFSTPLVVLKEIADAHSISYEENKMNDMRYLSKFINHINGKNVSIVREPYDIKDYKLIARYVNKNCTWKRESLMKAFNLLLEYAEIEKLTQIHTGFDYGLQTPDNPMKLNACVLYGICNANRINTRINTTIEEMASNIELLFSLKDSTINHNIKSIIYESIIYGRVEGYQLVNVLSEIDPGKVLDLVELGKKDKDMYDCDDLNSSVNVEIRYEDLNEVANTIINNEIKINPRTHTEAIVMAALYYKMDISNVVNPLAEYAELCRTPYFPFDRSMTENIRMSNIHPEWMGNPRLDINFNPNLPFILYNEEDLYNMCVNEGYKSDVIANERAYTLLQTGHLLPTFIHGKQGNIINKETTMLETVIQDNNDNDNGNNANENNDIDDDDIDDDILEYDAVVVYGIRNMDEQNNFFRAYSYGELLDTFRSLNSFQRPDGTNEEFSEDAINKLMNLCNRDQRADEKYDLFRTRIELGEEIRRVKIYKETNQEQVRKFIDVYRTLKSDEKVTVEMFLIKLLHCGMYMRGWTGNDPYPLSAEETNTPREIQYQIDINVHNSIIQLEKYMDMVEAIKGMEKLPRSLPLINYNARSKEFLPSTDADEGLTIHDRIEIVKQGHGSNSVYSCIRLTSNKLCASAYYYMDLLGMSIPFNIDLLSNIQ